MSRQNKTIQYLIDLLVLIGSYVGAFALRFEGDFTIDTAKRLFLTLPYVIAMEGVALYLAGVPNFSWRYVSLREAGKVLWALLGVTGIILVVRFTSPPLVKYSYFLQYSLVPVGVIIINLGLAFLGIVGVRAARRVQFERESLQNLPPPPKQTIPVLLIGAGQAGAQVARELVKRPDLGLDPKAFLDDDTRKQGQLVHGIRVSGPIDNLPFLAQEFGVREVLITIAEIDPKLLRRILGECEKVKIRAKILPGLYQLIHGQGLLGQIRDVSIEDLLGRESVKLDMNLIQKFLSARRVLVTGAGGSIGSELCRQVARFCPESLILVERSEFALFTIHQELLRTHPEIKLLPRICDVTDIPRLGAVFLEAEPHVVFHAAAHKHVPMMEYNPGEAIKNNVFGTKCVADMANSHKCEAFVMISTDKAVNPTSIMGASKRVSELYVQALSQQSQTKYVAVRFGNVLGSTGSVVPTFKSQIARGGPVTVTHPEMTRYFMTISEASQLVMQAASMGKGGEIYVLDMGEPVKIVDLASDLIRLSGLVPNVDIQIAFSGVRPGEKLYEEIGVDAERMNKTAHPKIYIGKLTPMLLVSIQSALDQLSGVLGETNRERVRKALQEIVPEMIPPAG